MGKALDLEFRVGDVVRPRFNGFTAYDKRTVEKVLARSLVVGGKTGSKYSDVVTGEVVAKSNYGFACHNNGAPFESQILDEEKAYDEGYRSGYHLGLAGKFYSAGGPWVSKVDTHDCRHLRQCHEYELRNNKAFRKGWAAGQERAAVKKKIDWTKPVRIVKDDTNRFVFVVGQTAPNSKQWLINVSLPGHPPSFSDNVANLITVDEYGADVSPTRNGYGFVIENIPERKTNTDAVTVKLGDGRYQSIKLEIISEGSDIVSVEWVKP